jgi:hypothetical protein
MITMTDVLTRIAVIEREIISPDTGGNMIAHDNPPKTTSQMDMPLFINLAKNMIKSDIIGEDERGRDFNETTNYDLLMLHSSFSAGVEGEMNAAMVPYVDLALNKFGSYPHLKGLSGVLDAQIMTHSGPTTINYIGQPYNGVRFTLQVITKVRRLLASLE